MCAIQPGKCSFGRRHRGELAAQERKIPQSSAARAARHWPRNSFSSRSSARNSAQRAFGYHRFEILAAAFNHERLCSYDFTGKGGLALLPMTTISIDCAPVLTLWASVVAERLGWSHDAALTLGHAVATMTVRAKGAQPGTCGQPEDRRHEPAPLSRAESTGAICDVPLLGRIVHVAPTRDGPRALGKKAPLKPEAVERYLRAEFGSQLCAALSAMERLAAAVATDTLNDDALRLYEHFRPKVPSGERGRGAKGVFDVDLIHALVRARRQQE